MGYTPPWLVVSQVAGATKIYGNGATTDDLILYGNPVDSTASITIKGTGSIILDTGTAETELRYLNNGTNQLFMYPNSPDMCIAAQAGNFNLFLIPNGTGKVKFGTFTASGDVAVNGSIAILDAAGNARKLATVA